jgi:hypothetical protein
MMLLSAASFTPWLAYRVPEPGSKHGLTERNAEPRCTILGQREAGDGALIPVARNRNSIAPIVCATGPIKATRAQTEFRSG